MTFYEKLADIFEEDVTDETILKDLEAYDSLSILSIIAMCDKDYKITVTAAEVRKFNTIGDLKAFIESKK
ncbi:MAG: acyl carrier protein [Mucispirillum sp.]|nr:acyl carrier protein [Mucispirillum sp.]